MDKLIMKNFKKIENLKKRRRKILINANKVIAVSNFMHSIANNIGVDKKNINVIYNFHWNYEYLFLRPVFIDIWSCIV